MANGLHLQNAFWKTTSMFARINPKKVIYREYTFEMLMDNIYDEKGTQEMEAFIEFESLLDMTEKAVWD